MLQQTSARNSRKHLIYKHSLMAAACIMHYCMIYAIWNGNLGVLQLTFRDRKYCWTFFHHFYATSATRSLPLTCRR